MTDPSVWEKKDLMMKKMNALNNATSFVAACINAGISHPESVDDGFASIEQYRDRILDYLTSDAQTTSPAKEEGEDSSPYPSPSPKNRKCEKCFKDITEGVAEFSMEHYGIQLCMDCQKHKKKVN